MLLFTWAGQKLVLATKGESESIWCRGNITCPRVVPTTAASCSKHMLNRSLGNLAFIVCERGGHAIFAFHVSAGEAYRSIRFTSIEFTTPSWFHVGALTQGHQRGVINSKSLSRGHQLLRHQLHSLISWASTQGRQLGVINSESSIFIQQVLASCRLHQLRGVNSGA